MIRTMETGLIRTTVGYLMATPSPAEFVGSRTASDASGPPDVIGCGGRFGVF
jgi:hypothetical protein